MSAVFLSASVPIPGRGDYYESADPFLIQSAVRECVTAVLGRRLLVWGGHPAITPMVWSVCEDLGVNYARAVVLYQSTFFADTYPGENQRFGNVQYIEAVAQDRDASLRHMRQAMLSRNDLTAAIFIGGMEGILDEYELFKTLHPNTIVLAVPAPGGAARQLAERLGYAGETDLHNVDFARLFHRALNIPPNEPRTAPA
jgi:hypothetical protein